MKDTDTLVPDWTLTKAQLRSIYSPEDALNVACKGLVANSEAHVQMRESMADLQGFARWCINRYWEQDSDIGDAALGYGLVEEGPGAFDSALDTDAVGIPTEGDEVWYRSTQILGDPR